MTHSVSEALQSPEPQTSGCLTDFGKHCMQNGLLPDLYTPLLLESDVSALQILETWRSVESSAARRDYGGPPGSRLRLAVPGWILGTDSFENNQSVFEEHGFQ